MSDMFCERILVLGRKRAEGFRGSERKDADNERHDMVALVGIAYATASII